MPHGRVKKAKKRTRDKILIWEANAELKMNRTVLLAAAIIVFVGIAHSPATAETKVCRGLLTANWTEGVANFTSDDGTSGSNLTFESPRGFPADSIRESDAANRNFHHSKAR